VALTLGQRPPDLTLPFRYADLGCGHGVTASMVAAIYPHAEVWAFDFNPAHIESGRRLAAAAGLTNLRFCEASFTDLAALPPDGLPEFDFMVSHGVASWVSPDVRASLIQIIGQRLRPGGLAYLSYNVTTGWAGMIPVHTLMRTLMRSSPERSDQAAAGILQYIDTLKDAGANFFAANPSASQRLAEARSQDRRYFAHEFLNTAWHPLMFADVAEAMAAVKCTYIGSARPVENLDVASVPTNMLPLMTETRDPILRETLRDMGIGQSFRRDIYRRGSHPLMPPEHMRLIDAIELIWTGRVPENPIKLISPLGSASGVPALYTPLMDMIMAGGQTLGSMRRSAALGGRSVTDLLQAISMLLTSGYVLPGLPDALRTAAQAGTNRLNAAICDHTADGGTIAQLASATTGTIAMADLMDMLTIREKLSGRTLEIEPLTNSILAIMSETGRAMQRDGKPIDGVGETRAALRQSLELVLNQRLPQLVRLGAIEP
jgi:SAM-dependent methyltransferase